MFKKAAAVATAAVMALAMFQAGCGASEESSITMDLSNEKSGYHRIKAMPKMMTLD